MVYLSLVSILWYKTPLRERIGVLDTHTLKLMAGDDILVTQPIQVGTKTTSANQISKMVKFLIDNIRKVRETPFWSGHWNSSGKQLCLPPC